MIPLSIIIPFKNSQKTLHNCLDSIIDQPCSDKLEIICVNDHSEDCSIDIASSYRGVLIYNSSQKGVSAARNLGLKKAKGEYVWFVDSDDKLKPDSINEEFLNYLSKYQTDFYLIGVEKNSGDHIKKVVSSSTRMYSLKEKLSDLGKSLSNNIINAVWNKIYKKEFLIVNNIKFPDYSICEDAIFNYNVFAKARSVSEIAKIMYCFNVLSETSTKKRWKSDQLIASIEMVNTLQKINKKRELLTKNEMSELLTETVLSNEINFLNSPKVNFLKYCQFFRNDYMRILLSKYHLNTSISKNSIKCIISRSRLLSYLYIKITF